MFRTAKHWLVSLLVSAMVLLGAQPAWAQAWQNHSAVAGGGMCVGGASVGPAEVDMRDVATIQGVVCLIANGLSVIMSLLVLLGFVMIVYGAIIYMISGGQPQLLQKGVDTIRMVIIGIILALSSFIIINIIAEFTGVSSLLSVNFIWQPRTP